MKRWNKELLLASSFSNHIVEYPTPANLNYMWSFGSAAGICLFVQIITGIFLAMYYIPNIKYAFFSVEYIMRTVHNGWIIRYIHANGASLFFIVVYLHIFRGLYFGSYYVTPLLWFSGIVIFFLMMGTAFIGYVLPWGQMSYWGVTVITSMLSVIPFVGNSIVEWIWGGFVITNVTLNRFYSFHYLLPFLIVGISCLHLVILHEDGSSNPLGINKKVNRVNFYPYFYVKDFFAFFLSLLIFFIFIFYLPNILGHADNYINADPMVTPAHIVPEWYFLPFYAILRSIPNKLGGVIAMVFSIICLAILPLLIPKFRAPHFRPFYTKLIWLFASNFLLLGWIGQQPVEEPFTTIGIMSTALYFFILLFLLPLFSNYDILNIYFFFLQLIPSLDAFKNPVLFFGFLTYVKEFKDFYKHLHGIGILKYVKDLEVYKKFKNFL